MRQALIFTALTFAGSWLLIGLFALLGGNWNSPLATGVAILFMFVPASVALVLERRQGGSLKALAGWPLRPNRWYLVAWLLPIGISLAAFGLALLLPGIAFDPNMGDLFARFAGVMSEADQAEMQRQVDALPVHPFFLGLGQAAIAAISINALAGWGEEVGWRGYLMRALQALGFWRSSLLIGLIWGLWHTPVILMGHNYPEHPKLGVLMMVLFCTAVSPVIQHVRERAGSVLAAAVFHGAINGSAGLAIMLLKGGNDLLVGVTGAVGIGVYAAAALLVWIARR